MTAEPPGRADVPSPCTGVCRIDVATGWCAGCLRSLDEIAGWAAADDAARQAVWRAIGHRRRAAEADAAATPAQGLP